MEVSQNPLLQLPDIDSAQVNRPKSNSFSTKETTQASPSDDVNTANRSDTPSPSETSVSNPSADQLTVPILVSQPSFPPNLAQCDDDGDTAGESPTEVTNDASTLPSPLPGGSVDRPLSISLHPQTSHDVDDDIRSPSDETVPYQESAPCDVVDLSGICEAKSLESCITVYEPSSLCVPFTLEKDEIVTLKEMVASTTTIITTEYSEPKKNKKDPRHIMISYNHSTKEMCSRIAQALKNRQYLVWIDQDNISGDIFTSMASAIENAFVVLMAVNEAYFQSRYCRLEAEYSVELNKASIPLLMQRDFKATGWLGLINGSKLHIDFSKLHFDEAFNLLVREIETIQNFLGIDGNSQTSVRTSIDYTSSMITTASCSRFQPRDVNEWCANDVIEWLNREKLEVFEPALLNFTGATLWQLYKVKFDSPSDYHRMVDSLLPPMAPLRLFYSLSFNGAIESLFSSSGRSKY